MDLNQIEMRRKELEKRRRGLRERVKKWAGGVAAAGVLGAATLAYHGHVTSPATYEARNPAMIQAMQANDYHRYDKEAINTHPGLKKNLAPTVNKYWDALGNIAGKKYNIFTVLDTLSKTDDLLYAGRSVEIGIDALKRKEAAEGLSPEEESKLGRYRRMQEIYNRASRYGKDGMLRDIYNLPTHTIRKGRNIFYDGNWEYGKPSTAKKDGSSLQSKADRRLPDPKSRIIASKARNMRRK